MGLRDQIKQRIRRKTATLRDAGAAAAAADRSARRAGAGARRGAEVLRDQLGQVEAGEVPKEEGEDVRTQAERAQRFAMMSPPGKARLDPIDVPHPYRDDRERRDPPNRQPQRRRDERTMEDLVLGRERDDDDADPMGLVFGDLDDDSDEFEGGLLDFGDPDQDRRRRF